MSQAAAPASGLDSHGKARTHRLVGLALGLQSLSHAHLFGEQQVIGSGGSNTWSVFTADLDGDGHLDTISTRDIGVAWYQNHGSSCPHSFTYCYGSENVSGLRAEIRWSGSTSHAANDLVLEVVDANPGQIGMFVMATIQNQEPFANTFGCMKGSLSRLIPPVLLDASGAGRLALDYTDANSAASMIEPLSAWNFQFWYRDPHPFGPAISTSDAAHLHFCP